MTVPTTTSAVKYTGTASTATYAFTWAIARQEDLIVYTTNVAGTTITQLTLTTDYTVSGVGVFTGGTITLTAGNLGSGVVLFIASDPEEIQTLLLQYQASFNPADLMAAVDLLTREVQALRRMAETSLHIPIAESLDGYNTEMPPATTRANGFVGFDSSGNFSSVGGTITGVTVSSAMTPVVQAATLALARAAMGLDATYLALAGGTMAGTINLNSNRITNVPTATVTTDAVNLTQAATRLVASTSSNYTQTNPLVGYILMDATAGNRTVAVITASSNGGRPIFVKKTDGSANTVTISVTGGATIDGAATLVLTTQNEGAWLVPDGTNYQTLNVYNPTIAAPVIAIRQTVSVVDSATSTSTSTSYVNTGTLAATLGTTYKSTASKVRIRVVMNLTCGAGTAILVRILRGATDLTPATRDGMGSVTVPADNYGSQIVVEFTDSPSNVTPATYTVQWKNAPGNTMRLNASGGGTALDVYSVITLEEIVA